MNERREPTISPLSADADTTEAPRAKGATPQDATAQTRRSNKAPPPVSSRPVVVRSPLGPFALLLALAACGGAGYLYWLHMQGQQTITDLQTKLEVADERLVQLEERLALSDDESTQSITVIQAKVKENATEIRKLWGVAYDTNRKAIAELKDQYEALNKALGSADKTTKQALKDISGELQVLSDLTEGQQVVVARADQFMNQQTQSLDKVLSRVETIESNVDKRISANEEAIRAIDAFRVQVNRELIQLKGG